MSRHLVSLLRTPRIDEFCRDKPARPAIILQRAEGSTALITPYIDAVEIIRHDRTFSDIFGHCSLVEMIRPSGAFWCILVHWTDACSITSRDRKGVVSSGGDRSLTVA